MYHRITVPSLLAIFLAATTVTVADDWPQWRGPRRDGVWRETGLIEKFDGPQLKLRWRAKISSGYSGPTVAAGRVYVMDRVVDGTRQSERILCFDSASGKKLWIHEYDCPYRNVSYPAGPRASVTIDAGRALAHGTMGHLHCLDAATGKVLWKKNLNAEYDIRMPNWGLSCSPLIEKDLVIIQMSGSGGADIVALDTKSGQERWRALDDSASYSSPIVIDQANKRVLVCRTGERIVGIDAGSGQFYWGHPLPPKSWVRDCASPVNNDDRLLLSGFFSGSLLLRLRSDRPAIEKIWHRVGPNEKETDGIHVNFAEPLFVGEHIYGIDSYGELRCLDAKTGDRLWESLKVVPKQRWSTARLIPNGDRVWIFTELGELIIARLSPAGYEELSRAKLIKPTQAQLPSRRGGVCWSHPAFAGRHVFARSDEELVCASLERGAD